MRHSRSTAYREAWEQGPTKRWNERVTDPNDPAAIAHRARALEAAWMAPIDDRVAFLVDRCRDRHVLDVGCVAHDATRLDDPTWLHRHLATAAASCVGVDILEPGVAAVRAAGFEAICHDLSTGLGPLASRAPFDVIVAGEIIEHLTDLDMLFQVAHDGLTDAGELILTTPNPYAPARVRAGQRGIVWENADHVSYLFPSGVAELAARNGLVLSGATTIDPPVPAVSVVRRWKRFVRGSGWQAVGYDTVDRPGRQAPLSARGVVDRLLDRRSGRFTGETFVYVITRGFDR